MDFRSDITTISESTRAIKIEIPRKAYQEKFNKLLGKTASQANIKGFRPGKAPKSYIEKLYGPQIKSDVLGDLFDAAYQQVVSENKLKIIGRPKVDWENANSEEKEPQADFVFKAEVSLYPEPELKSYRNLKLKIEIEEASEKELEARLLNICEQQSDVKPLEGREIAELGDLAMLSFQPLDEENAPLGKSDSSYVELGKEGQRQPLGEAIVGMKVGEEKESEIEAFAAKVKEKVKAKYHLKLISLHTKVIPELSDQVAKNSGIAETLEDLKAFVKQTLEQEVLQRNKQNKEEAYALAVFNQNPFEVPQPLIDEEVRRQLFELGFLDPNKHQSYHSDVTRFREIFGQRAELRAKQRVVYGRIRELENPSATEEEIESWLNQRAEEEKADRAQIDNYYAYPERKDEIKDLVALQNLIDSLISSCQILSEESE